MNSKLTVLTVAFVVCAEATAQSITPQVLSNCGASASDADYRMDWTLGEFAIASIGNSQHHLTQGFHQPFLVPQGQLPDAVGEAVADGWSTVWPNPAQSELNISFGGNLADRVSTQIFSLEGKLLLSSDAITGTSTIAIPIGDLAAGSYLAVITSVRSKAIAAHRFIKILQP